MGTMNAGGHQQHRMPKNASPRTRRLARCRTQRIASVGRSAGVIALMRAAGGRKVTSKRPAKG